MLLLFLMNYLFRKTCCRNWNVSRCSFGSFVSQVFSFLNTFITAALKHSLPPWSVYLIKFSGRWQKLVCFQLLTSLWKEDLFFSWFFCFLHVCKNRTCFGPVQPFLLLLKSTVTSFVFLIMEMSWLFPHPSQSSPPASYAWEPPLHRSSTVQFVPLTILYLRTVSD